jgi:hypothetical protein
LHKYNNLSFKHVKDVPEIMNAVRLEIAQEEKPEVTVLSERRARAPESGPAAQLYYKGKPTVA